MRIAIRGGYLLDPASERDGPADLFIADGRIAAVGEAPSGFSADRDIDAGGRLVLPGLVDLAARFREPGAEHKATIAGESGAAAAGGVTTVCCPPDTTPVIDTPAVVELIHRRAEQSGRVRMYTLGALTHGLAGERLAEMEALREAGCVGVSNGLAPVQNSEVLRRGMEYAASFNLCVFLYAEDHFLRNNGVMHEGAVSTRLGLPPVPAAAETVAVSRALILAEQTGARLHFCRISCAASVELIARAKAAGLAISADTGICHLYLSEHDVDGYNSNCHLVPPLRSIADRAALLRAVADGTIDAVCSDHQPHDADAKAAPFSLTEPGASTIELLLPLVLGLAADEELPLRQAIMAVTRRPAEILGIAAGTLAVGAAADVAVVDREAPLAVEPHTLVSAGKNCPFLGTELHGRLSHTIRGGAIVFES